MSKDFLDRILDGLFGGDYVGAVGETYTGFELKCAGFFGKKGRILRNIYIPKNEDETTEIDLLYITQKGIFVLESKNYSGWIFGDEKDSYWTASLPNGEKNRFYNPIKQNRNHIKYLSQYLNDDIPMYSLIVFSNRCELKKITVESIDVQVVQRERVYAAIRNVWEEERDCLSEEQIDDIYNKLEGLTNADKTLKQKHIENIDNKYKNPKKTSKSENESQLICPKCGAALVLRTAKKGANVGNQFYGCSNYPRCHYIQNI